MGRMADRIVPMRSITLDPGTSERSEMTRGATAVLAQIGRRYWASVYRYLLQKTRSEFEAEDLTQEVYIRLSRYENLENINNRSAFIYRIALNVFIDWKRFNATRNIVGELTDEIAEGAVSEEPGPERQSLANESMSILSAAVERLPAKCRRVFIMHKIHRMSYEEIEIELGLSKKAIEKHVERGMLRVKSHFEKSFRDD
jgi:RNA polymerase sigma factor (sigma-70 family)